MVTEPHHATRVDCVFSSLYVARVGGGIIDNYSRSMWIVGRSRLREGVMAHRAQPRIGMGGLQLLSLE
jgi:hypothetical protein